RPKICIGSLLVVHSSWLPGTQMTLANRRRSKSSAQRISSVRSATSPQTISQSSGVDGYSDSVTGLLPTWPVCKSDTAHSVGCRAVGGCCPCSCQATTPQPNGWEGARCVTVAPQRTRTGSRFLCGGAAGACKL